METRMGQQDGLVSIIPKITPLLCVGVVGWCNRKFRYLPEEIGPLSILNINSFFEYIIINFSFKFVMSAYKHVHRK